MQRTSIVSIVLSMLLIAFATGCANVTPQDQVSRTEQAFTDVVLTLNIARAHKAFDDKTWALIVQIELSGNAALDALRLDVDSGNIKTLQDLQGLPGWRAVTAVLDQLATFNRSVNAPRTRPATGLGSVQPRQWDRRADRSRQPPADRRAA